MPKAKAAPKIKEIKLVAPPTVSSEKVKPAVPTYVKLNILKPLPPRDIMDAITDNLLVSVETDPKGVITVNGNPSVVGRRNYGNFTGKGLYLEGSFDWIIAKDSENCLVLIPMKKG